MTLCELHGFPYIYCIQLCMYSTTPYKPPILKHHNVLPLVKSVNPTRRCMGVEVGDFTHITGLPPSKWTPY